MAQPRHRRAGQSRRAQYGRFFGYVVAVAGILVGGLLLLLSYVDPRGFQAIKGAFLDVTAPISDAGRSVLRGITDFGESVGDYVEAGRQNGELRDELRETQAQLIQAQAAQLENQRLRQMLQLRENAGAQVATGRIVSSSWDSVRRFAILSAGRNEGVLPGMPVRAPEGLVGRVLESGNWGARVLMIVDANSNVPVRLVRDGTPAIARGRGDGLIELRTLEVGQSPFRPGDMVVTSGVGGIFPPDVPVAQVVRIDADDLAIARPLAAPSRIDYAIVQPIAQPAAVPVRDGGTATPPPEPGQ